MSFLKKISISCALVVLTLVAFSSFAHAEENKTGIVTCEVLNLREKPDTSSKILVQLDKGTSVTIFKESDEWYNVSCHGINGWASSRYITVKESAIGSGVITGSVVNVRNGADISSDVILKLEVGTKVTVLGRSNDWYKIKTSNGSIGWVYKDYLAVREQNVSRGDEEEVSAAEIEAEKIEKKSDSEMTQGERIVAYAKRFLGVRYVWGGNTPQGFDCSGFVKYVFNNFGIDLERVAANQAKQGVKVSRNDLKPGDVVFFDTNGGHNYINHVGIYIGDGKFIHASSSRSVHKVTITSLSSGFYSDAYMTSRRFVK